MNIVELKKGIYSVGAVDWNVRNFHGYTTNRGATYNAYLIIDEKVALIDTVKAPFAEEMIRRIKDIIDPSKIDYVISNHVEMDHSGGIPAFMQVAPQATIVTSDPNGMKGLLAHYGQYNYMPVKAGDTLSLGKRTLAFVTTPMVHWPDNMVTYCPEEKILFSNDALGQHFASTKRFDDEVPLDEVYQEAAKYYANIVMPYGAQTLKALEIVGGLDIEMVAPSHGVIWRKNIAGIIERYSRWAANKTVEKAVVIYDSMWHSTEKMAHAVLEGFAVKGIPAKLCDLKVMHISDIMAEVLEAKYICVGSPTLNNNIMPTVAGFLTYLKGLAPKGDRKAMAFGSYGWSGQSIGQIEVQLLACGFGLLCENIRQQYIPSEEVLNGITEKIAKSL